MTFLPVLERELRVSARKRSTFWLRVVAGLVAFLIGSCLMLLSQLFGQGTSGFGAALFGILTWLALAAAVSAGFFFTADALSEEKREGTLGFLFLTNLRGYDVAGGKLLATSLRGSYALLAFFPILAATLLMGGVTGAEFWKTTAALLNALLLSLGLGLLISAISWDSQKAMAATFVVLLMVSGGGPAADAILAKIRHHPFKPVLSLFSPVYVFESAGAWGSNAFWSGLLATHLEAWLAFGLGSFLVRRTWQDRLRTKPRPVASLFGRRPSAAAQARSRRRLESDPVRWLVSREHWQPVVLLLVALLACLGLIVELDTSSIGGRISAQFNALFIVALYLWTASLAARFFVDTRRDGFLELLMVTPLSLKEVAWPQWRAWKRQFAPALILFLIATFVTTWLSQNQMVSSMISDPRVWLPTVLLPAITAFLVVATKLLNLCALFWFGMWMAVRSKNTSLATLKTICFVQVIPLLVFYFLSAMAFGLITFSQVSGGAGSTSVVVGTNGSTAVGTKTSGVWLGFSNWIAYAIPLIMTVLPCLLAIGKDLVFIRWSRGQLSRCSREQAVLRIQPGARSVVPIAVPPLVQPPPLTPPPPAPPPAPPVQPVPA